jgi:hypothetical protein
MPVIWKRENITSFESDVWMTVSTPKRYTNPFPEIWNIGQAAAVPGC